MSSIDQSQYWLCQVENKEHFQPPAPGLQNCLCVSNNSDLGSVLCDFGTATILKFETSQKTSNVDSSDDVTVRCEILKTIEFGNHENLQAHAWSQDGEFLVIGGEKVYVLQVEEGFKQCLCFDLYYVVKDVAISKVESCKPTAQQYLVAIAGPDGVEVYSFTNNEGKIEKNDEEYEHLHADLAIGLVEFSPDTKSLAVAALDGHFGTWTYTESFSENKDFWYVLLNTLRISDVSFSPDSQILAAACWDGSCYLYKKVTIEDSVEWKDCCISMDSPVGRISGLFPGSFLAWSPCSRYLRLSFCSTIGSQVTTLDTRTQQSTTVSLSDEKDCVKGMTSVGFSSTSLWLYLTRNKRLGLIPWPSENTREYVSKNKEKLVADTLSGTVWIITSTDAGGVHFRVNPPSKRLHDWTKHFKEMSKKCVEISHLNTIYSDVALENCKDSSRNSCLQEGALSWHKHDFNPLSNPANVYDKVDTQEHMLKNGFNSNLLEHANLTSENSMDTKLVSCLLQSRVEVSNSPRALERAACEREAEQLLKERKELITDFVYQTALRSSNKCKSHNGFLHGQTPDAAEGGAYTSVDFCNGNLPNFDISSRCLTYSDSCYEDARHVRSMLDLQTIEELKMRSNGTQNGTDICSAEPFISEEPLYVHAPFMIPDIVCDFGTTKCRKFDSISGSSDVLLSSKFLVVVVYPLVAYIFSREKRWWKAMVFCTPVITACLVSASCLMYLTTENTINIYDLIEFKNIAKCSHHWPNLNPKCCHLIGSEYSKSALLVGVQDNGQNRISKLSLQHGNEVHIQGMPYSLSTDVTSPCSVDKCSVIADDIIMNVHIDSESAGKGAWKIIPTLHCQSHERRV